MNLNRQPSRARAVASRWIHVLLLMLTITPAMLLIAHWQQANIAKLDQVPTGYLAGCLISVVALSFLVGVNRFIAFVKPLRSACWPSSWISIVGALGVAMIMLSSCELLKSSFPLLNSSEIDFKRTGLLLLSVGAFLPCIGAAQIQVQRLKPRRIRRSQAQSKPLTLAANKARARPSTLDIDDLMLWVSSDKPITSAKDDLFGHIEIASRITSRLVKRSPAAQTILGSLGTGKSSLCNLVSEELKRRHERSIRLVPVSLWPFSEPLAAVEGIVAAIAQALEKDVNAFVLKKIAAEYGEAISKAGTSPKIVLGLLSRPRSPWAVLSNINEIALSVGLHFVVWVEDLERFTASGYLAADDSLDVETKLSPLRSLLHALEQLNSFTIVTVTTSLLYRFDVDKISVYIERIPDLTKKEVLAILGQFRDHWKKQDYLDPEHPYYRSILWAGEGDSISALLQGAEEFLGGYSDAIAYLCSSPRLLKRVICRCNEAWFALRGEVDLDELIAVVSLREASPRIFSLLERQVTKLQYLNNDQGKPSALASFNTEIDTHALTVKEKSAAKYLVGFLFEKNNRAQGIAKSNHANYWTRIVTQIVDINEQSDQSVLCTLLSDDDEAIIRMLGNPNSGRAALDLSSAISTLRCIHLLPLVCASVAIDAKNTLHDTPQAFMSLWRILLEKSERENIDLPLLGAIEESALCIVQRNPLLFVQLVLMYASDWEKSGPLTANGLSQARALLCRVWLSVYSHDAVQLSRFLAPLPAGALRVLLISTSSVRLGLLHGVRRELASTLMASLAFDAQHVLPQIAPIVVGKLPLEDTYIYKSEDAVDIFGASNALLLSIPESVSLDSFSDGWSRRMLSEAKQLRARQQFVTTLNKILDHPEVMPDFALARI